MRCYRKCVESTAGSGLQKIVVFLSAFLAVAQISKTCANPDVALYTYEVVGEIPHDPTSFTQGLQFDRLCQSKDDCRDIFWESTGLNGESKVRAVAADSGEVLKEHRLERKWFGEGLVKLQDRLYQLTWLTPSVLVYDTSLNKVAETRTPLKDGWGLTTDGRSLIVSDGSHKISWLDPSNMQMQRQVEVFDGSHAVHYINELEMVEGEIWANVWQTECIAQINPESGKVTGWVLMKGLREALAARQLHNQNMDVLNGIAYDTYSKRLFVTGKLWPRTYEIKVLPMTAEQSSRADVSACHIKGGAFMF